MGLSSGFKSWGERSTPSCAELQDQDKTPGGLDRELSGPGACCWTPSVSLVLEGFESHCGLQNRSREFRKRCLSLELRRLSGRKERPQRAEETCQGRAAGPPWFSDSKGPGLFFRRMFSFYFIRGCLRIFKKFAPVPKEKKVNLIVEGSVAPRWSQEPRENVD